MEWYSQKAGIITASKVKRVYTAQLNVEKTPKSTIINLVNDIIAPKCHFKDAPKIPAHPTNARDWGLVNEDSARKDHYKLESKKHHKLSIISKGLLIFKPKPIIGVSVDNIRTCSCNEGCADVVEEYKCPWKHRNITAKEAFVTPM